MGPRLVLEDTELSGTPIPKGAIVLIVWGAANRDEQVFTDADRFDVERQNVKEHLAFGCGPHFCLGAPLGRMEATIAFELIFARLANLRFAEGRNEFANHRSVIFRGPAELFIEFQRAD
jgi:cytochrome P450